MNTPSLRPSTLLAVTLLSASALVGTTQAAVASGPTAPTRSDLRAVSGDFDLSDGRVMRLRARALQLVVGVDDTPAEAWHPVAPDLFASPDGHRRLRLQRDLDGTVRRVALEVDRAR